MPDPRFVLTHSPDDDPLGPRLSYADVTERLLAEFGPVYGLKSVSDVVRCCRTGEDGLPRLIAPESLEHLARGRLQDRPVVLAEPGP